jgi:hypothetical protein
MKASSPHIPSGSRTWRCGVSCSELAGAVLSMLSMGALIAVQLAQDLRILGTLGLRERISRQSLTAIELCLVWAVIGALIYWIGRRRGALDAHNYRAALRVSYLEPDA